MLENRKTLWDQLGLFAQTISNNPNNAWLVGGDFNKILTANDKFGENPINYNKENLF